MAAAVCPTTSLSLTRTRTHARCASSTAPTKCTGTRSAEWSPRRTAENKKAGLPAEECFLQIALHGLVAEPDPGERLVEGLARDRALGLAVQAHPRRALDEVERDDILLLHFLERFHDRRELVGLRLDRRQLGGGGVLGAALVWRVHPLIPGERR